MNAPAAAAREVSRRGYDETGGALLDRLLDWTLLGYTRLGPQWRRLEPLALDLAGRTAVVTGATSGIGRATARGLAAAGARVIIVGRHSGRLAAARDALVDASGEGEVHAECADLSSMVETRRLAARILSRGWPLHLLVNNAGVMLDEYDKTPEGVERTFATNVASHFLLTELLLPRLRQSSSATVVNVSSGGMYSERLDIERLEGQGSYDGVRAYAQTKRAQVVLSEMWSQRLGNSNVRVHSMHPGWADTPGVERALPRFHRLLKSWLRTPEQAADTVLWLCAEPRPGGLFWHERRARPTHRRPRTRETPELRDALLQCLRKVTGTAAWGADQSRTSVL
jgi:NAD(P)-dependent dehydrogenase (short-subunit alcohol dehydrogenase family)